MFKVQVFSGGMLVDEQEFASFEQANEFASESQDLGFKVRFDTVTEKKAEYA